VVLLRFWAHKDTLRQFVLCRQEICLCQGKIFLEKFAALKTITLSLPRF
jgi:hypothetical protein